MGFTFNATSKAADAPNIEADIYDALFNGLDIKHDVPSQYGKSDCIDWMFTLLDDDGATLYDDGDPVEVDGLTSTSMNTASKTTPKGVRYLKAIATADEFAEFVAGKGIDAEPLIGRPCQVEVVIKENGWPTIVNVLPARRRRASRARTAEGDAE